MNLRDALLRLIGMVAFAAALLVAPSLAQAHGGHDHASKAVTASGHHNHHAHNAQPTQPAVQAGAVQEMRALDVAAIPDAGAENCAGGCCVASHCAACVVAVIPPPFAAWPPVDHAAVTGYIAPALLGAGPDLLRRPPKFFV